jgi:hypothetical protein
MYDVGFRRGRSGSKSGGTGFKGDESAGSNGSTDRQEPNARDIASLA